MWITALLWEALRKRKPQHEVGGLTMGSNGHHCRMEEESFGGKGPFSRAPHFPLSGYLEDHSSTVPVLTDLAIGQTGFTSTDSGVKQS